jgi:hypothetical protein
VRLTTPRGCCTASTRHNCLTAASSAQLAYRTAAAQLPHNCRTADSQVPYLPWCLRTFQPSTDFRVGLKDLVRWRANWEGLS